MNKDKVIERSVDSLQRIYSFILAFSIGQAITIIVLDAETKQFKALTLERLSGAEGSNFLLNVLPIALAFFVTIIPFHQGMNRHLDFHYLDNDDRDAKKGLLLDFFVFMAEGGAFFAIASSIRQPNQAYVFFGLLLLIDVIWAVVARLVHGQGTAHALTAWPGINFLTIIIGIVILAFSFVDPSTKGWLLFTLALLRTVIDYKKSWKFYFPFEDTASPNTAET